MATLNSHAPFLRVCSQRTTAARGLSPSLGAAGLGWAWAPQEIP
jgi:hypothetical protein